MDSDHALEYGGGTFLSPTRRTSFFSVPVQSLESTRVGGSMIHDPPLAKGGGRLRARLRASSGVWVWHCE